MGSIRGDTMGSIIIYYSGTDTQKTGTKGSTQIVAEMIQDLTGGDIFRIEPKKPYSTNLKICIDQAKSDWQKNARPEIKSFPENIQEYDTIYLGYPNYWGTMPMHVFTLLEGMDVAGKVIKPFCTNEGSGIGSSPKDIARLCPLAKVEGGLSILGSRISAMRGQIEKWVLLS